MKRCLALRHPARLLLATPACNFPQQTSLCQATRCLSHQRQPQPNLLLVHQSQRFASSAAVQQSAPNAEECATPGVIRGSILEEPLKHPDFFGVKELVTVEDLFHARVHFGHKKGSRNENMKPYLFGCRLGIDVIDLDQTLEHMHRALNFVAHVAYRKGIILFIMKSPMHGHTVELAAKNCGEYAHTRQWRTGLFTNASETFYRYSGDVRLPDVCLFLSTRNDALSEHPAVVEAAKVSIASVGIVDSNVNPSIVTYPVPGNDDSPASIQLYCRLFKTAIMLGKEKRKKMEAKLTAQKLQNEENTPSNSATITTAAASAHEHNFLNTDSYPNNTST